ncbi:MAG: hypothetical protein ACOCRO_03915 [Halanaerobiales bacterium]
MNKTKIMIECNVLRENEDIYLDVDKQLKDMVGEDWRDNYSLVGNEILAVDLVNEKASLAVELLEKEDGEN